MLDAAGASEQIAINDIIYAEVSAGYEDIADFEAIISAWQLHVMPMPRLALFRAGKAYQRYRKQSGIKTGVLPDFFIGAHAAAEGWPLLTRDTDRVRSYFPETALIAP